MFLLLLLAVILAAVLGANSSANCVGPAIGGGALSFRKGLILTTFFVLLGLALEGPKMMGSVGGGILVQATLPQNIVLISLAAALAATGLATYLRFPISTSQSLALAVIGVAAFSTLPLNTPYLQLLGICWAITPFASAILAILLYHLYNFLSSRTPNHIKLDRMTFALLMVTIAYSGYTIGANTGGFLIALLATAATGPLITIYPAAAFSIGLLFLSRGIIRTVGTKITQLGLTTAMIAQLAAAITLHIFTNFGLPVSQSQAVVGGVVGVGLAYGTNSVNFRKLRSIVFWWAFTPAIAFAIAYALSAAFS